MMSKITRYTIGLVLIVMLLGTGCFSSPPLKKVQRDPIPVETVEMQEQTRTALDAILKLMTEDKSEDASMLVSALLVKYGSPVDSIHPTELTPARVYDLRTAILISVQRLRAEVEAWKVRMSSETTYEQGEKTFVQKAVTGFWTIVIIVGLLMLLCPTVVIGAVRWFRGKIEKAKAAIEEEKEYQKRKADQTVEAIRKFRKVNPEGFEALEPHLKESHDKDIQADIKNGRL